MRRPARRRIAERCFDSAASEKRAQLVIRVAREKLAQIFSRPARNQVVTQQPLDSIGRFFRRASVSDWTPEARVLTYAAAQAEVVRVHQLAVDLDLLAFHANICKAMLATTVGTSGNVQSELLIELRELLLKFFHQPARERLCFCNGQLAEFGASASYSPTPERRSLYMQTSRVQSCDHSLCFFAGHVNQYQVLSVRGTQRAVSMAIGKARRRPHLLWSDAPAQDRCANVEKPRLPLRMYSHVIAKHISRYILGCRWFQSEAQPPFYFMQKCLRSPAVAKEEVLEPRALAVLTQNVRLAKYLADCFQNGNHLVPPHKCIQPDGQVRLRRKASTYAQREPNLAVADRRSEGQIVNFRVGAPVAAAADADFVFAGKVVEIRIAYQQLCRLFHQR